MAPSRRELQERIKRLPQHLQEAARKALSNRSEEHLHSSAGAVPPGPVPASSPWPGYLVYLQTAPIEIIRDIAVRGNYLRLGHEERIAIRLRLGWTSLDVIRARDRARHPGKL